MEITVLYLKFAYANLSFTVTNICLPSAL